MHTRQRRVQSSLSIVLAANLLTAGLKTGWGLLSNSNAMLADGVHSLGAAIGNAVGMVAAMLVRRDAGHQVDQVHRYEHRAGLAVAGIMFVSAGWLGWRAVDALLAYARGVGGHHATITRTSFAVLLVSGSLNLAATWYARRQARLLDSPALRSGAHHTMSDFWSTVGVLVASAMTLAGLTWADSVAGLVIAGIIASMAVVSVRESLRHSTA